MPSIETVYVRITSSLPADEGGGMVAKSLGNDEYEFQDGERGSYSQREVEPATEADWMLR